MDKKNIGHHISHLFNEEVEAIRHKTLIMGGLVEQQMSDAIEALMTANMEMAENVIQLDTKVNSLEQEIDADSLLIIAKRQPAAFDLRLLMAITKTITELERIGDQATRVAHMAIKLEIEHRQLSEYRELKHIAALVKSILHDALDVFARLDIENSVKILAQDEEVTVEYESVFRQLTLSMMEDNRNIKRALNVMSVIRSLERTGDHACNICEYTIYAVRGEDVRHLDTEAVQKKLMEQ